MHSSFSSHDVAEKSILDGLADKLNQPLDFGHPQVSLECREASAQHINQLRDFELWALQSITFSLWDYLVAPD